MCVCMCVCACLSVCVGKYLFCPWGGVSLCPFSPLYFAVSFPSSLCNFQQTLTTLFLLLHLQINEVTSNHLRRLLNNDDELWQCIADQGDLKVYKRELEENGIVIDPVKAVCTVKVCAVNSGIVFDPVKAICTVKIYACIYMPVNMPIPTLSLRFVLGGKKLVGKILTGE